MRIGQYVKIPQLGVRGQIVNILPDGRLYVQHQYGYVACPPESVELIEYQEDELYLSISSIRECFKDLENIDELITKLKEYV